ncbi:hypothetical protein JYU34_002392 [Plutella xylostella]|uniref:RBR-type E3 ubiquitin transferase n=1 Tax=Plutella xylostella TaxID=51655 RepID=A0ABQ7R230_PLUXY|nr:hypothetical protein JYU34_002392 [Plutella xylostella]
MAEAERAGFSASEFDKVQKCITTYAADRIPRAISLEALASSSSRRDAERGLELARLMGEAERAGFSASEVSAALAQSPGAPLAWLRTRWPSLVAGVRAAAARLAGAAVSPAEARAALARSRGAMWPAVTDCVDRLRKQVDVLSGSEGRQVGRVWGSPAGADDDAAPPRAEESSDEYDGPRKFEDDWIFMPLESPTYPDMVDRTPDSSVKSETNIEDIAYKLKMLLNQAGIPDIDENLLLKGLTSKENRRQADARRPVAKNTGVEDNSHSILDLGQSENDFIDAYNALTRLSPLPLASNSKGAEKKQNVINTVTTSQIDNMDNQASNVVIDNVKSKDLNNTPKTDLISSEAHNPSNNTTSKHKRQEVKKSVQKSSSKPTNNKTISQATNIPLSLKNATNVMVKPKPTRSTDEVEEKSNNLSDIVDNTQKLIQQMKDEINSDINSTEDRNTSESRSDESSNEDFSEHESSYTDTERSEEVTSEEQHSSSVEEEEEEEEEELVEESNTVKTQVNRTSSEENDQFEEALDHIEEQMEDFKKSNFEVLDSIARSLQEEQTITVETNVPIPTKPQSKKIQDFNNNFRAVNSFDEIYEELSIPENDKQSESLQIKFNEQPDNIISGQIISHKTPERIISPPPVPMQRTEVDQPAVQVTERIIIVTEHEMSLQVFTPSPPTRLHISQNDAPVLNATIDVIEDDEIEDASGTDSDDSMSINESNIEIISQIEAVNRIINNLEIGERSQDQTIANSRPASPEIPELISIDSSQQVETPNVETENTVNNERDTQMNEPEENTYNVQSDSNNNINNAHKTETNEVVDLADSTTQEIPTAEKENSNVQTYKNKTGNEPITKSNAPSKSSIPKPISKNTNNKNKNEKGILKVIASKVPVRRNSTKQYPAPAPPKATKATFGGIQNGTVKQLQTRLFSKPKPSVPTNETETTIQVDVKASTSTMSKKKPAPAPPVQPTDPKRDSPSTSSPKDDKKKKKQYFRESCRTEDEWTESDSDGSQERPAAVEAAEDTPAPAPPPPPVTMRRVSGVVVDLAAIRLPEGSPERQARMLLASGATETWQQAQLAVELVGRGAAPPAALLAALECVDLAAAMAYLNQDCELCASKLPEHEMVSMLRCTHRCCRECARHYYTVQITERSIADCVCPYCKEPELENLPEDEWLQYFSHLDIQLKTLVDNDVHELFQRKLRDRTLAMDPNFRWCVECSSGFFVHPKHKKLRCPECRSVSCAKCRKPWTSNHEGLSCEQYATWLEDNDPERSVAAVQQHLRENGLDCPRCHFKYSLSRGGCMHFTCTQCKYEFCYGCGKPFTMGARCGLSEYCARLGLHAHHPRNCLFYLRDKEPHELQTLLQMNNIEFSTEAAEGSGSRCPVQLQRETPAGLVDTTCGADVPPKHAGLCKAHYVEYLAARARGVDPIPIMAVSELVAELRRRALPLPERGPWDTDPVYAGMCAEIVREKIPLD